MRALCIASLLLLCSFDIPDLIPPPIPNPFFEQPAPELHPEKIQELEAIQSRSTYEEYELALYYIVAGQLDLAIDHLQRAITLKPNFLEAQQQLAFIYIWQNQLNDALRILKEILAVHTCDRKAQYGLILIAPKLPFPQSIEAYQELSRCSPSDLDIQFTIANIYQQNGHNVEAKKIYIHILKKDRHYTDVALKLAMIYEQEKNLQQLEILHRAFPSDPDINHIYARALSTNQKYKQARRIYANLPPTEQIWRERFEILSHSDVAILLDANYTGAKENDPTLRVPVVKDYYFYSSASLLIPALDQWRLELKGFLYRQRENDILPPVGTNYNAFESGGVLTSRYFFAPNWRWDVVARGFSAWGIGNVEYPFVNTARFEPGTTLFLNSEHLFVADAHVESFITKNFTTIRSQLYRTDYLQTAYGYRPDIFFHPQVEAWVIGVFYHDNLHNIKNKQSARAQLDLYFPSLTTFYLFEHSGFKYLNQNYFSYFQQLRHTIELKFHKELRPNLYFEMFWDHTWEQTYNLFLPVGNFVFVAPKLYLIWNTYTAQLSYRYKDFLKLDLSGHYLYNTLPYRDYNIKGSLTWQF